MGMDMKDAVIVTALFDIGRDNWRNFSHSYHTYLEDMKILLSIDCKMIIYTEEKFQQIIGENRLVTQKTFQNTEIRILKKEDLEIYKKYGKEITKLMESEEYIKKKPFNVPESDQPWYNFVNFNKAFFIKDAYKNSIRFPNHSLYIWKDAAVYRSEKHLYHNRIWPDMNKVDLSKITFFVRGTSDKISSIEDHVMSQDRRIQGGCFLLPAHYIEYFCNEFENQLKKVLDLKVMGSDEKMMDLVYLNNPEFCKKIQCEWRQYWKFFKY